jgi:hypothetical protein
MRVRLCERCPYTPPDLEDHYDPTAALHLCAKCDREPKVITRLYPRENYRRRKCATVPNTFEMAKQGVARSATDTLVLSGITRAEPPCVRERALIASGHGGTATVDGCSDFELHDSACSDNRLAVSLDTGSRNREPS